MSSLRFNQPGCSFLDWFFKPIKDVTFDPVSYFTQTFVEPPDFEDLLSTIRPRPGDWRVVVIDGQSRVGKTWSVVGAVATLLEQGSLDQCWTAGEDSYRAFEGSDKDDCLPKEPCYDILEGLRRVHSALKRKSAALVFLDDFFGTVRLRPLVAREEELPEMAGYLNWEETNNLLRRALPETGGTLVLTNRATLLTAAELKLGFSLRLPKSSGLLVKRSPRGFFRRGYDGKLAGAFDEEGVKKIFDLNKRFSSKYPTYKFPLPHLVAFAPAGSKELVKDPRTADALFGADLNELALECLGLEAQIETARSGYDAEVTGDLSPKLEGMYRAYLISIAPGLIFPGPSVYTVLGIQHHASELIRDLYLRIEDASVQPGRIPNEYYARALARHLADRVNIGLAARVLTHVLVNPIAKADPSDGYNVKVRNLRKIT